MYIYIYINNLIKSYKSLVILCELVAFSENDVQPEKSLDLENRRIGSPSLKQIDDVKPVPPTVNILDRIQEYTYLYTHIWAILPS